MFSRHPGPPRNINPRFGRACWCPIMTASELRRNPVTLAIADVNPMAGRLLSDQFKRHADIAVVSCTADKTSLLKSVRETKPDVAIIGTDLQDGLLSGLVALR